MPGDDRGVRNQEACGVPEGRGRPRAARAHGLAVGAAAGARDRSAGMRTPETVAQGSSSVWNKNLYQYFHTGTIGEQT